MSHFFSGQIERGLNDLYSKSLIIEIHALKIRRGTGCFEEEAGKR